MKNILQFFKRINYILIAAWVIPIGVLLTILYLNFLPFGYEKTLTINVGEKNDDKGEFRLEMSPALGSRQELDGETFRYLDGLAYAIYEPKVVLRDATIEAELTASTGVSFILPPDLTDVKWDYDWNTNNISDYFEVEASEADIYNAFLATPSEEIEDDFVILSASEGSNPLYQEGQGSRSLAECPEGGVCSSTSTNAWALELTWQANRYTQLLYGDIYLEQNAKEIYLNYKGQILKYPLPDYFLGQQHTAIIAFDGKNLYLTTNQNENSTKVINIPLYQEGQGSRSLAECPEGGVCNLPPITVHKYKSVTSWSLHTDKISLIKTQDDAIYLDGSTRLTMPNTADKFEDGPFTVYAEWTPEKAENGQQIIGHYNWEIWQNEKTVSFQVGRMSTSTGPFYKISYNIDETFFNKPHALLAVYSPISTSTNNFPLTTCLPVGTGGVDCEATAEQDGVCYSTTTPVTNGYIELFVDGVFAGREYFANETIWKDYNNKDLSFGWTSHNYGQNPNFQGSINEVRLTTENFEVKKPISLNIVAAGSSIRFAVYGTGELTKFKIGVKK